MWAAPCSLLCYVLNLDWTVLIVNNSKFLIGPFPASFWILFSFLDSLIQLICLQCSNARKKERRSRSMYRFVKFSWEIPPTPCDNSLIAFSKNPSRSRDPNPARSDRMPSLYHLRHHHCPVNNNTTTLVIFINLDRGEIVESPKVIWQVTFIKAHF